MHELLRFKPLYQDRVWGGRRLQTELGRRLPEGSDAVGESWELVDRAEAQSEAVSGPYAGQTFRTLLTKHAAAIMGPRWAPERPFPILVKWLDCRQRLSLQVHPPAGVAAELAGEPKTENWYIAATSPGAELIVGLKRGVTKAQFEQAIADNTLEDCVHRFAVAAGDSILVHSGQIHAIDAGNLILEIQQNSDTTYRVYDWGRLGLDGRPRTLHVAQSLRSIDWTDFEPAPLRAAPTSGVIASCPEFEIRRVIVSSSEPLTLAAGQQPRILSVVSGEVAVRSPEWPSSRAAECLKRGDNVLLPYAGSFVVTTPNSAIVLVTENFVG